jgi:hypothetical protein
MDFAYDYDSLTNLFAKCCTGIAQLQDLRALVDDFTSPALAAALRDRESTLQVKCKRLNYSSA